jgi:hypothetical protein
MTIRTLLRRTAVELHVRGSVDLAREVLAEASGYPEADRLPDPPETPEGETDWKLGTSDFDSDLGAPPYDKPRPYVRSE